MGGLNALGLGPSIWFGPSDCGGYSVGKVRAVEPLNAEKND
jgi:hypothetical protein